MGRISTPTMLDPLTKSKAFWFNLFVNFKLKEQTEIKCVQLYTVHPPPTHTHMC